MSEVEVPPNNTSGETFVGADLQELERVFIVGLPVFLQIIAVGRPGIRHKTTLCGWESGQFIILDRSSAQGLFFTRADQACTVRFMREGEAWGFRSTILDASISETGHLIRVAWPRECARVALRRHKRAMVDAPCVVQHPENGETQGRLADVSTGGCRFCSHTAFAAGSELKIAFKLPDGIAVEDEPIIVRNCREDAQGMSHHGCEFKDPSCGERSGITLFVERSIVRRRGAKQAGKYILMLTKNRADAEAVEELCAQTHQALTVSQGVIDAFHAVALARPSMVLINAAFEEMPADDVCRIIKRTPRFESVPLGVYGRPGSKRQPSEKRDGVHWLADLSDKTSLIEILGTKSAQTPRDQEEGEIGAFQF